MMVSLSLFEARELAQLNEERIDFCPITIKVLIVRSVLGELISND